LTEFLIEQPAAGYIGLEQLAVNDELRNGSLADAADELGRCGWVRIHIDFCIGEPVDIEEILGCAAIAAPRRGVDLNLHSSEIRCKHCYDL